VAGLNIALPAQESQTEANLRRWEQLIADPTLSRWEGRVETDRFGRTVVYPVAFVQHSMLQTDAALLLGKIMQNGCMFIACPVSTADGVKVVDVAWASSGLVREVRNQLEICFPKAPEICVEVLSPSNTEGEISERIALYFDAGAVEVWICGLDGDMRFFTSPDKPRARKSVLCPKFPARVKLEFD
jgi:Uma2 family endonuclease